MIITRGWGTELLIAKGYGKIEAEFMKNLILAIQTALRDAANLSYITDANIFITADENLLPITVGFPAIGLKDGGITKELVSVPNHWKITYNVDVTAYALLSAGETPIIGQADPLIYGILDINANIHTVLHENELSLSGVMMAYCAAESPSEWMGAEDVNIQKKKLTYYYEKLETL